MFECKKIRYGHRETAETAAVTMQERYGGQLMEAYYHEDCKAWHIGHSSIDRRNIKPWHLRGIKISWGR